jgi:phage terminase large subunit-like protein
VSVVALRDRLQAMDAAQRAALIGSLPPDVVRVLQYDWQLFGRPKQQRPDGDWRTWLILAGRGWGKTRTGAEAVREWAKEDSRARIALVARTAGDVRDTMIEGESGILAISPPWERPKWEPSKRRLTWPNGAQATTFSADTPNALRGPQHHKAWADELASWDDPDAWDQLMFGLRLGNNPQAIVTTTPRPTPIIRELVAQATESLDVRITGGSTYENRANLARAFIDRIVRKYEGTRLGRQELYAEVLGETPGALWNRLLWDQARWRGAMPALRRIVVACDPAVSNDPESGSNETGIVVAGVAAIEWVRRGEKVREDHGFLLDDLSGFHSADGWANVLVNACRHHKADLIVAEVNNGGDLVERNIRTVWSSAPYKAVHATRGKRIRAEPASALFEQNRVHVVGGMPQLEDQSCTWSPDSGEPSPDRMDAMVWALTELMLPDDPLPPRGLARFNKPGAGGFRWRGGV